MDNSAWSRGSVRISSARLSGDELTTLLELSPGFVGEKGERMSPKNPDSMIRSTTVWVVDSGMPSGSPLSAHIQALVDLLEPMRTKLAEIVKDGSVDLFLGFTPASGQSSDVLNGELLARLGRLPVDLTFDFYGGD